MKRNPFAHPVYYLRRKPRADARGRRWAFFFHDAVGNLLLEADFPEIPKEATLFEPGRPASPLLSLKAWRWFWWNGRYDVVDGAAGDVLGTLRRTGGIEGPDRRQIGRVIHPMPLRKSFVHLFCVGVLNVIFSGADDSSALPADEFRVQAKGLKVGTLRRVKLPFPLPGETAEAVPRSWWKRGLYRFRSAVRKGFGSGGWELDFTADEAGLLDPRLRLASALLRIQIEERYS